MQYMQQRGMGRADSPWPEALARRVVREAVEGVSLINALRVEPELGSPARGGLPATVARRTSEGWRLIALDGLKHRHGYDMAEAQG